MRKTIIFLSSVILVFLVAFFSLYFILTAPKSTGAFSVDNYAEYIQNDNFQTDENTELSPTGNLLQSQVKKQLLIGLKIPKVVFLNGWAARFNMMLKTIYITFAPTT